jgi:hypothetical protein
MPAGLLCSDRTRPGIHAHHAGPCRVARAAPRVHLAAALWSSAHCSWGYSFDPALPVATSARANPDLVKISVKSARWFLALERTWLKKISEIKEMLYKFPAGGQIVPVPRRLHQWSVWLQEEFIRRVVNLIKNREACDRDTSSKKLIDGTTEQELQFFHTVAVPGLVEAGFTQIPIVIAALQTLALHRQCPLPDNLVDQIPYGSAAPANMCWIDQFKNIWRNARM